MKRLFVFVPLLVCLLISACSTTPVDENDPASLYKEAEAEAASDHFQLAIEKLRSLKNKFPYSKYAVDAQLKIGDVYFMEDLFAEAAASYETFKDLHPKHPRVAYAMFRAGKSYFNDAPTNTARDLGPAQKAIDAYRNFLARFPTAPEVTEAQKDVATLRGLLAVKELSIAEFYYQREFYHSAKPRYEKIIQLYSDTESAKLAQERLADLATKPLGKEEASANGPR